MSWIKFVKKMSCIVPKKKKSWTKYQVYYGD